MLRRRIVYGTSKGGIGMLKYVLEMAVRVVEDLVNPQNLWVEDYDIKDDSITVDIDTETDDDYKLVAVTFREDDGDYILDSVRWY
jgi:hypothetical protein